MFLRSNLRSAGLRDRGKPYEATWAAAARDGEIVGLAALNWNGVLLLQAPHGLSALVPFLTRQGPRAVRGVVGPWDQLVVAVDVLGLAQEPAAMRSKEDLFSLSLADLKTPPALTSGRVVCQVAGREHVERLVEWGVAYDIAALGEKDSPELWAGNRRAVERFMSESSQFVALAGGMPVATSTFNARLPDCVQIGGVWTPPPLRGRGYARAAVAGSLLVAREAGVSQSILFTGTDNIAASKAYEAIGCRRIGDYGILLFRGSHDLRGRP